MLRSPYKASFFSDALLRDFLIKGRSHLSAPITPAPQNVTFSLQSLFLSDAPLRGLPIKGPSRLSDPITPAPQSVTFFLQSILIFAVPLSGQEHPAQKNTAF